MGSNELFFLNLKENEINFLNDRLNLKFRSMHSSMHQLDAIIISNVQCDVMTAKGEQNEIP